MYYNGKERFKLTRPKNADGTKAYYFEMLEYMADGTTLTGKYVRDVMQKHMTFQAMREKRLLEYSNGRYSITERGKMYVAVVNSSNIYDKEVLKVIMHHVPAA